MPRFNSKSPGWSVSWVECELGLLLATPACLGDHWNGPNSRNFTRTRLSWEIISPVEVVSGKA